MLSQHRGMRLPRRKHAVEWWLHQHTEAPAPVHSFIQPEARWVLSRLLYGAQGLSLGHMIAGFDLCRGLVVQRFMHAGGIPPMDPVHGFEFNLGSRSEEHTSELQSRFDLVCRLLLEKKKIKRTQTYMRPTQQ